jgi:hypothetical protein
MIVSIVSNGYVNVVAMLKAAGLLFVGEACVDFLKRPAGTSTQHRMNRQRKSGKNYYIIIVHYGLHW